MELRQQHLEISGNTEISFVGDMEWTVEAIGNIIKNCIEHTPGHGTIKVHYDKNQLFSRIVIEDTGPGIDKEDLPHIFERFYKGKNAGKASVGIGLALSKMIIEKQNGSV